MTRMHVMIAAITMAGRSNQVPVIAGCPVAGL